ncbi:T9SS type A sorting domain-containing protein [Lacinutrix undariae]
MKKQLLSILTFLTICIGINAQNVNIPDANFKTALVANTSINTNGDSEIQVSEATAFTGNLTVNNLSISDLTGIEAFVNITELYCNYNSLTDLDISANTALTTLVCDNNSLTDLDVSSNTALKYLLVGDNSLTSLDISTNTALRWLYADYNAITSLDISSHPALQRFYCSNNNLTSLNVANGNNSATPLSINALNNPNLTCIEVDDVAWSTTNWSPGIDATASFSTSCTACVVNIPNANLKQILVSVADTNGNNEVECTEAIAYTGTLSIGYLGLTNLIGVEAFINVTNISCPSNNITSYDFSANTQLTYLYINDNNFTSLDVSSLTNLETLYVSFNNLTSLDVSNLSNLEDLAIYNNQITGLDVSTNTSLESLHCGLNSLTSLNVANGNNTNFTNFNAESNPNLTCIQVDDVAYSTTTWADIDPTASYSTNCSTCTVNIPDANFKTYLVGNATINTNGDTEIQCSEATAFTGEILVAGAAISDLTGIEAFTNLTELNASNNTLTSLDVSTNTALTTLSCALNQLTSLDVSVHTGLENLYCYDNLITNLDVSFNTDLIILNASNNPLASFDVSVNTALEVLSCQNLSLTSLDISNNLALKHLFCDNNPLGSIDVSAYPALETLSCENTSLTSLDISNNTALVYLYCGDNTLGSLDVSAHISLIEFYCNNAALTSLNLANGNNTAFPTGYTSFSATNNPNLTCVQVDDVAYSNANWSASIDATASYSTDCTALSVNDFTRNEVALYPNPTTSVLNIKMTSNLKQATIYSVLGRNVLETTSKTIQTSNLKTGLYLIKIEDENGNVSTKRFMKQ